MSYNTYNFNYLLTFYLTLVKVNISDTRHFYRALEHCTSFQHEYKECAKAKIKPTI